MAKDKTFTQDEVNDIVQDRLARDRQTRVVNEPRVYAPDSPHSYFADVAKASTDPAKLERAVHDRLARYAVELAREVDRGTPEGQRVERILLTQTRSANPDVHEERYKRELAELRALTTGTGTSAAASSSASVFVSPYFANEAWAPFRGISRVFADQCQRMPLPAYGGQIYVPYWSTTDSASQLTEGSGTSETDPTSALQTSTVVNVAAQITLSQQVMDRCGPGGGTFDQILYKQLCQQLEEKVDAYALQSALTVGTVASGSSSAGTGLANFFTDLAVAREGMTDTAGTRLRPTALFTTSDQYNFWTRQTVTATGVPLFTPILSFPGYPPSTGWMSGADDGFQGQSPLPRWRGYSGTQLPGGVAWFTDDNIPASGSNTNLILTAPDEALLLFENEHPTLNVFPQTEANNLEIVLTVRKYVAFLARHIAGVQILNSGAYPTSNK